MDQQTTIDRALKRVWMESIQDDYLEDRLPNEDTLKNAIYHHLRRRLTDRWLRDNRLRVFTEYPLDGKERADLAVVRLKPKSDAGDGESLFDRVEQRLCLVECKFKGDGVGLDPFILDVNKVRNYAHQKDYADCLFYLATIDEEAWEEDEAWLLDRRQMRGWGRRVVEFTCSYVIRRPDPVFRVISYNSLNPDLSSKYSPT